MIVEICRIRQDVELPKYHTQGAGCFDLAAAIEVKIKPNEVVRIPSGLIIKAPEGYVWIIAPRSGLPKTGLVMPHSIGIMDSDFCGVDDEALIQVKNVTDKEIVVEKGQRLAQVFFIKAPRIEWREVSREELGQTRGGFGSTGSK